MHHQHSDRVYVTTLKDLCRSNKLSVDNLHSTQEEADTRIMLHALDATYRGATSVCIQSPDTDVLVLALWCYPKLCNDTSMIVGTRIKHRVINVGLIYNALREGQALTLPGFHALSGCDQTGTFCGKSKLSWWNALQKSDSRILQALANLGNKENISEDDMSLGTLCMSTVRSRNSNFFSERNALVSLQQETAC